MHLLLLIYMMSFNLIVAKGKSASEGTSEDSDSCNDSLTKKGLGWVGC